MQSSALVPTVLVIAALRFFFYSNEGAEPAHVHVNAEGGTCKFWLEPVGLARHRGLSFATLRKIEDHVHANQALLREKYRDFHGR